MRILKFDVCVTSLGKGVLNPFTGPQVQALFLNIIARVDPSLAKRLHEDKGIRPYAVRPLRPKSGKKGVVQGKWLIEKGHEYVFSLSALTEEVAEVLAKGLTEAMGEEVTIGRVEFAVRSISVEATSVEELIKSAKVPHRILLVFRTPTHFKLRGTSSYLPFPLPWIMYANLAGIWNSLYPYKVDLEEFAKWLYGNVLPRAFEGKTREVWVKEAKQVGYRGRMEFVVRDSENRYARWVYVLTRFAEFANTGAHRTMGMGVVEITEII